MPGCRGEGDRQHDVEARRAQIADDDDVEHHHREGEQDVADEGQDLVPPAAEIARGHAHQHADDVGDGGGERGPDQHPLRAPDQAREDVAALVVGAEREEVALRAGRPDLLERGDRLVGVVQRQDGREDGHRHPEQQDGRAQHADRALAQEAEGAEEAAELARARRASGTRRCWPSSAEPDARVEQGVADVGDELGEHGDEHRHQRAGLDQVDVAEGGARRRAACRSRDRRRTPRPRSRPTAAS